VVLRPLASDPDGHALTWTATGLPAGLTITAATGQIAGTLLSSAASSYTTGLTVRDPGGLTAGTTFTWNTTAAPLNGLLGEYFSGMEPGVGTPLLRRTDPTINFDWGGGSPAPSVPVDFFSARWTGTLTAPFTETYTIYAPSDNGVRIWINNQLVLDKWAPLDISGWHNFTVPLTAGQAVPIKVEYAELYGGAGITLYWFSDRLPWEVIANNRLSPTVSVPAGSSPGPLEMIRATQRLVTLPDRQAVFTFRRPAVSAQETALLVQESTDLKSWTPTTLSAEVNLLPDGTEEISVPMPLPKGTGDAPPTRYFRVRVVIPDPTSAP